MTNEVQPSEVPKLTVTEKVGYGFGDLASNMFWQMFSIFIAKYYTDVFLLSAATMGTMLLVTRIIDAFVDPVIGAIADRTKTRWGSFRPYLIWMSIPMAVTAIMTFSVPEYGGTARVIYAFVTLTLMMIAYSAINIPYSALLGVLTPNSQDRTSVCSYRFVMALIPVFIIVNTAIPFAKYFGGSENSAKGWQMTMIIYSVVAVVLYFATFALTKERVHPEPGQKTSLKGDIKDLLANRPWVVLCAVGIAALTYANIRNTVSIYYFENVVSGGMSYFGPVMTTGALAFIAGVMLTSPLSKKFGKRKFYMVSMGLTTILTAAFYFVPTDNITLIWSANTLINFVAAPTAPLVWAMYADTADYSEWKTGRRATGLTFSAASFAQKLGWAIGGAGTGWLLAYFGYQAATAQSAHTINGIMMMMSVIPAVASLIAMAALWFYELDEDMVKQMTSELALRRAKEPVSTGRVTNQVLQPDAASDGLLASSVVPTDMPSELSMMQLANGDGNLIQRASPSAPPESIWAAGQPLGGATLRTGSGQLSPHPMTDEQLADLVKEFQGSLQSGVHGLCFSPYLEGQSPGSKISESQIRERLKMIRPYTRWIRSFSCTDGHEQTPRIAHELGIKTLVGAWLGTDRAINERELQGVIDVARTGHADIVAVGNEVLLREDLSEDELLDCIQRVKDAVPGMRVGYVDAYYIFEKHPRITAACDVILTNCYPFWEGCPREQAVDYMQNMLRRTQAVAGGKPIIISETGWPDRGSPFHGAVPSMEGAIRYFMDTMNWAQHEGVEVFYFEAFDEAWKVGTEGDVGAYWGIWDKDGQIKYV